MKFILASASPRRREILRHLGLDPIVVTSKADESVCAASCEQAVAQIAQRKAQAVRVALMRPRKNGDCYLASDDVIVAADTMVLSPDGERLGKPSDREDSLRMLRLLSGREHRVISGICVMRGDVAVTETETTYVTFAPLSEAIVQAYANSGEGDDKAGAYGIQDTASLWIESIRGDYFNVVGLPVHRLEQLLCRSFGLSLLDFRS